MFNTDFNIAIFTSFISIIITLLTGIFTIIGIMVGAWVTINTTKRNIKSSYELSDKQLHNSFQLAAMDKRLEAQQNAYYIWYKMSHPIRQTDHTIWKDIYNEAKDFWIKNCLYLEQNTMEELNKCIFNYSECVVLREQLQYASKDKDIKETNNMIIECYEQIRNTGKVIMAGVKYPFVEIKIKETEKTEISK